MLIGHCNQCGLCCMDLENRLKCVHLVIKTTLGLPDATYCDKYASRYDNMPIILENKKGEMVRAAHCAMGGPIEEMEIVSKGIGRGCSLKLVGGDSNVNGRR